MSSRLSSHCSSLRLTVTDTRRSCLRAFNHGERGKRKLADQWDSTPYDVVFVRSGINVYRIKDAITGRERVVHRNLLLQVDFLTVDETPASLGDSDLDVECGSGRDSVEMNDVDGYNQTMDWLMHSPDTAPVDVVHSPDPASVSVANSPDHGPTSVAHSSDPVSAGVSHLFVSDVSNSTFIEDVDENIAICLQPCSVHAGQGGAVTTKYGRHVRPPKKLIHEMSTQKVEHTFPGSSPVYAFFHGLFKF